MQSNFLTDPIQPIQAKSSKGGGQTGGQSRNPYNSGFMTAFEGSNNQRDSIASDNLVASQNIGTATPVPQSTTSMNSFSMAGENPAISTADRFTPGARQERTPPNTVLVTEASLTGDWSLPGQLTPVPAEGGSISTNGHTDLTNDDIGRVILTKTAATTNSTSPIDELSTTDPIGLQTAPRTGPDSDLMEMNNGRIVASATDTSPVTRPGNPAISQIGGADPSLLKNRDHPIDATPQLPVVPEESGFDGRQQNNDSTVLRPSETSAPESQRPGSDSTITELRSAPAATERRPGQAGNIATSVTQSPLTTVTQTVSPVDPTSIPHSDIAARGVLASSVNMAGISNPALTESAPPQVVLPNANPVSGTEETQLLPAGASRLTPTATASMLTAESGNTPLGLPQGNATVANLTGQALTANAQTKSETPGPVAKAPASMQSSSAARPIEEIGQTVSQDGTSKTMPQAVPIPRQVPLHPSIETWNSRESNQPFVTVRNVGAALQTDQGDKQALLETSRQIPFVDQRSAPWTARRTTPEGMVIPVEVRSAVATQSARQKLTGSSATFQPAQPVSAAEGTTPDAGSSPTRFDTATTPQPAPTPVTAPAGFAIAPQPGTQPNTTAILADDSDRGLSNQITDDLSALPEELTRASTTETVLRDTPRPAAEVRMSRHVAAQLAEVARQLPDRPMEISLNPEELGRVKMTLSASESAISVTLLAERGETADLLRRNLEALSQEFRELGYKDISFNFAGGDAQQQGGDSSEQSLDSPQLRAAEIDEAALTATKITLDGGVDIRL